MASIAAPYRRLFREYIRSGSASAATLQTSRATITAEIRSILRNSKLTAAEAESAALFLKSQRQYKVLLDRYNPLHDLTAEEHIKATARRVGLDMPITPPKEGL